MPIEQPLPYRINAASQRGHPPHSGDRQTHASNLRIKIEAFVPPKPKEFESTVRKRAGRVSFATMFKSRSSSNSPKLMLEGTNWCSSANKQKMASTAPAAPNE